MQLIFYVLKFVILVKICPPQGILFKKSIAPCILMSSKEEYCEELVDIENFKCHVLPYKVAKNLKKINKVFDLIFLNETNSEENNNDNELMKGIRSDLNLDDLGFSSRTNEQVNQSIATNKKMDSINSKINETDGNKSKDGTDKNNDVQSKVKDSLDFIRSVLKNVLNIMDSVIDIKHQYHTSFSFLINNSDIKNPYQTVVLIDLNTTELAMVQIKKDELHSLLKKLAGESTFIDNEGNRYTLNFDKEDIEKYKEEIKLELLSMKNSINIVTNNNQEITSAKEFNKYPKEVSNREDLPKLEVLADNEKPTADIEDDADDEEETAAPAEPEVPAFTDPSLTANSTAPSLTANSTDPSSANSTETNPGDEGTDSTTLIATIDVDNTTLPENTTTVSPGVTNTTGNGTSTTNCTRPCGCNASNTVIFTFPTEAPPEPPCSMMGRVWNYCVNYVVPAVAIGLSAIAIYSIFVAFL